MIFPLELDMTTHCLAGVVVCLANCLHQSQSALNSAQISLGSAQMLSTTESCQSSQSWQAGNITN